MPLSDTAVRNAKPRDKAYKLADGAGLLLLIQPNGGKWWRFKFRFDGKEGGLSFGVYPEVSLKLARERRDEARKLVARGINPSFQRQQDKQKRADAAANSFESVAREWLAKNKTTWAASHFEKVEARLNKDVLPYIGRRPVGEVKASELLACLRRIEARGALETAKRALTECGQVLRYAIASGLAETDPSRDLRGALAPANRRHFAAITDSASVGALMRAIDGYQGTPTVRAALQLSALLFQRPGEIRSMEWAHLDFERAEWRYIVSKTKTHHIVPLPWQALATLQDLHPLTGHRRYVFPSARSPAVPMSDNAARVAMRIMGYTKEQMTPHGFRAMARSLLAEMGWRIDAIERQLAHKAAGPLGGAYDRAQYLPERKAMMQAWADYLSALQNDPNSHGPSRND